MKHMNECIKIWRWGAHYLCSTIFDYYLIDSSMPSSASKSPSNHKNRKRSVSGEKRKGSRSGSSGSSHSSRSSRSRRSGERRSRSQDKGKDFGRYPPRRDTERIPQSAKLFVTNIDSKYSQEQLERDLRNLFEPFGKIKEIIIKTKQGSSNSYVFIEYEEVEGAVKAQAELKSKEFKGKELKVEFGRGQRKNEDRKSDKCYICHKEGHFAKDCRYNRYTSSAGDMRGGRRDPRDDRDRRDDRRRRSRSRSSSSRSYRRRHSERDRDRDEYRRRDTRRSPQKRGEYYSRRH